MAEQIMQVATGFWASRALYAMAQFGVADIIHKHGGPATSEEIAAALQDTDSRSLFRLLRFIASLGFLDMQHHGSPEDIDYNKTFKFGLNETSRLLRSDVPDSLRSMVLLEAGPTHYQVWSNFPDSVKTGQNAVKASLGTDTMWEYLERHPDRQQTFNDAMTSFTAKEVDTVLDSYPAFADVQSIVDIGGGLGALLFAILRRHPSIKQAHLYDLPSVVKNAVVPEDLKDRVQVHGGSFLDEETGIPTGVDLYIMKHIIHDWDDHHSKIILNATRRAMPDHAKVLLLEYPVPLGPQPCFAKAFDLHMMTMLSAKERTKQEYAALFRAARLELTQLYGPDNGVNAIEARAVVTQERS